MLKRKFLSVQVAKVVHEMVEPVLDAETVVRASSSVQELDWLISLLPAARFASIPTRFMDQVSVYCSSRDSQRIRYFLTNPIAFLSF